MRQAAAFQTECRWPTALFFRDGGVTAFRWICIGIHLHAYHKTYCYQFFCAGVWRVRRASTCLLLLGGRYQALAIMGLDMRCCWSEFDLYLPVFAAIRHRYQSICGDLFYGNFGCSRAFRSGCRLDQWVSDLHGFLVCLLLPLPERNAF